MKQFIFTLSILILFLGSSSCIGKYESGVPRLTLWHQEDAAVMPYVSEMIDRFEKKFPGKIKVEQVHYETEDLHHQFLTSAVAGAGPDLVLAPGDQAGVFSIGKFILPVEELFDMNKYVSIAVDAIKDSGHIWGIPLNSGNHLMMFINRKLAPRAPKTTDDMIEMCKEIKAAHTKAYCFATNNNEPFFIIPWLTGFGGWPIDGQKPTLNTPELKNAFSYFKKLKDELKIMPRECDYNCMDGLFKEGSAAFIINGDWAIEGYRKQLKENFYVAKMPIISETNMPMRPMVGGRYFMLNGNLKGERLKWVQEFVKFYTSEQNQLEQFEKLGRLPGLKAAFDKSLKQAPAYLKDSFEEAKLGRPMPIQVEMRAVWDAMRSQQRAFMGGEKDAATAASLMQKDAERKIKEMRIR